VVGVGTMHVGLVITARPKVRAVACCSAAHLLPGYEQQAQALARVGAGCARRAPARNGYRTGAPRRWQLSPESCRVEAPSKGHGMPGVRFAGRQAGVYERTQQPRVAVPPATVVDKLFRCAGARRV
jgi:hypothetical protein